MGVPTPEDMFTHLSAALNSGDMNAVLALYEADAGFISGTGELARGESGLRAEFQTMISGKVKMAGKAVKTIVVKDLALVFVQYTGTIPTGDGKTIEMGGLSTDVLRQQADGTWLSVIDNPFGAALVGGQPVAQEILDAANQAAARA
jgi:uncharacterized protein (TIGR02246 family)